MMSCEQILKGYRYKPFFSGGQRCDLMKILALHCLKVFAVYFLNPSQNIKNESKYQYFLDNIWITWLFLQMGGDLLFAFK